MKNYRNTVTFIGIVRTTRLTPKYLFEYLTELKQYKILKKCRFHDGLYYCIRVDRFKHALYYPSENFVIGSVRDAVVIKYNFK